MSYRAGIAIGNSLAGMGVSLASTMRQNQKDQFSAEKHQWDKEDRAREQELTQQDRQADEVAALLGDQGEKADLSAFDPISRFKGTARYADSQAKQNRNSSEGIRLEKDKMGMSLQRVQNIGREYLLSREQGDSQASEKLALDFVHHARNGVRSIEDIGNNKIRMHHMDGSEREIDKPTPEQMDRAVQGYLSNPAAHIQNRLNEKQSIREQNFNAANNAELWTNSNGQEVIAVTGMVDPDTREIKNQFYDAQTMQQVDENQVKSGGFQSPKISKDRAETARDRLSGAMASRQLDNVDQVIPTTVYRTENGAVGKTIAGPWAAVGNPGEAIPREEAVYNQVVNDQGEYVHIKKPGPGSGKAVIGSGVKAPGKSDDKIYTVTNLVTGKSHEATEKQIRANMKANMTLLKEANPGKSSRYDPDRYRKASPKVKKTMLGDIEGLMRDANQSPRIRAAAGQILGAMEALEMTGGGRASIKSYLDRAKKALDGEQGAAVLQ